MREGLKHINGTRQRFIATYERFGVKSGWKGKQIKTLLFVEVKNKEGVEVADHIWFADGLQFKLLNLQPGEKICFDARVKTYTKGYKGRRGDYDDGFIAKPIETDYKLSHPNNIVKHISGSQGKLF
jgi:hypothetical protein